MTGTMSDGFWRMARAVQERDVVWAKSPRWKSSLANNERLRKLA